MSGHTLTGFLTLGKLVILSGTPQKAMEGSKVDEMKLYMKNT